MPKNRSHSIVHTFLSHIIGNMSLTVDVYTYDPKTYEIKDPVIPTKSQGTDLAGLESWRTEVYGSSLVKTIGCKLLPLLVKEDLFIFQEDLDVLQEDCKRILKHIKALVEETHIFQTTLEHRINNILLAIEQAHVSPNRMVIIQ